MKFGAVITRRIVTTGGKCFIFIASLLNTVRSQKEKKLQGIQPYSGYDVVAQLMYHQKQLAVMVILNINKLDLPTLHLSAGK